MVDKEKFDDEELEKFVDGLDGIWEFIDDEKEEFDKVVFEVDFFYKQLFEIVV